MTKQFTLSAIIPSLGVLLHTSLLAQTMPPTLKAAWPTLEAQLFTADHCLFKDAAYCVRDADFVAPLLSGVLNRYYNGTWPQDSATQAEVLRSVSARYRQALYTAEGLRRVEGLLAQRFAQPQLTHEAGVTRLNFGVMPGTLTVGARNFVGLSASPHLENGEWRGTEVAHWLHQHLQGQARTSKVELVVQIPNRVGDSVWVYQYSVSDDRIAVFNGYAPSRVWATRTPLGRDFRPYLSGERSLHTRDLIAIRRNELTP